MSADSLAGRIPAAGPSEPPYPKIELHVHLEGAVRPATLFELARRNGMALPVDSLEELERFYEFSDFDHFIDVWNVTTHVVDTADDFRQVVVDYAKEAASFGVVYLEGIFSPGQYLSRGIESRELFEGYTDGIQDAFEQTGVIVRLTPDIDRNREPESSLPIVEESIRFRDRGIVGVGLGGRERAAPTSDFVELFARARDGGLAAVPHAGEDDGARSVREAVELLGADRIRHGFRAIDDPSLVRELRDRRLVLDVCPTSNLRTRVVPSLAEHPLPALLAAGLAVTVNTDDPAMFGTDLGVEHRFALSVGADARELYEAGVVGQVAGPEMEAHLRAVGDAHWGARASEAAS
ncbi:adenosine deaminase [Herbiconiux moechotypicola]|uniref:Adenosine deaminase n=1 Tax=Herbiconiux moechotypicola TaxID=637393 RepID=A0ABP5Q4J9_9MICO|nr:adenosine deaminase [Herbiconiux moechotypicola]MCS5728179.1 adenosine deaminase [Herbiconiux moechotypicola]